MSNEKQPNQDRATEESISESDLALLDNMKLKKELATADVKQALVQRECVELQYSNMILKFAVKYALRDGDIIGEDGSIKRVK